MEKEKLPKSKFKPLHIVYLLIQFTWGLGQTACGFLYFLLNIARPHRMFHGAIMTMWKKKASLSLGAFIFVSDDPLCFYQAYKNEITEEEMFSRFAVHEYGHTIQSLIWGPLYLVTVGISSVSWAMIPFFWKMRERKQLSYFSVYPEIMANFWGEKVTGKISPGQIV